jgi:hypothetical protein
MRRAEFIILGFMLFAVLLAFPAFRDVQLVQSLALSLCSGLGLI